MFAIFNDLESFNKWHQEIKDKLNYPLYGTNALTGETDYENPTTEFTHPRINSNDSRIVAWVGAETDGLLLIDVNDQAYVKWKIRYPKPNVGNWIWDDNEGQWVNA